MPAVPKRLREHFKAYNREGFHLERWEGGKHFKVWFREFPEMVVLTGNNVCPRAITNNIAMFKRLAEQEAERKRRLQ